MEESDGNMVRFRLVFDDRHLLHKSLRSQGLRRCWFLLKPGIATVADLASHIRKSFGLHDRIVLLMDDFVLPSFESTSIITDKDIITVKKKDAKQKDICDPCDDDNSQKNSRGSGSSDKEILFSCMETAVLNPPDDVGLVKRKRKNSKKLLGSKSSSSEKEVKPLDNDQSIEARQLTEAEKESGQSEENNHDHELELCNNPDVRKSLLFVGSSSMNGPTMDKENNFPQTTDNDRCPEVDEVPLGNGLLPVPFPDVMPSINNVIRTKQFVHFKSLLPLRRLPVKDDILVYRCAEQSSSVYPELSPPRVGKVSSFDYKSFKITLCSVLDYEILLEGNPNGASVQQTRNKGDEYIEVDYSSLVDVRLLKIDDSEEAACQNDSAMKDSWEEALAKGKGNEVNISPAEQSNGWSQWVLNKSTAAKPLSCNQPNAPVAGRGNGRTYFAPRRGRNMCTANRGMANMNSIRYNNTNLNPYMFAANGIAQAPPWSYRAPGLSAPWDAPFQTVVYQPGKKHPASGNQ